MLDRYLGVSFVHDPKPRDVGLVQPDPLTVDLQATSLALNDLHDNWSTRFAKEREAMAAFKPDLLLADIPYLPIAVAADLAIPSIGIASLSWDHVVAAYYSLAIPLHRQWWQQMRDAYGLTTLGLLPDPAIEQDTFPVSKKIPPIAIPAQADRAGLRQDLHIAKDDNRPIVLVSLGGIPATSLPIAVLAADDRWHWISDIPLPANLRQTKHMHYLGGLPNWTFRNLSASVDAIVSKPGYGMAVASVYDDVVFLYVRRGTFPDEELICSWLQSNGRSGEIAMQSFLAGEWSEPLTALLELPKIAKPDLQGVKVAVAEIAQFLV